MTTAFMVLLVCWQKGRTRPDRPIFNVPHTLSNLFGFSHQEYAFHKSEVLIAREGGSFRVLLQILQNRQVLNFPVLAEAREEGMTRKYVFRECNYD